MSSITEIKQKTTNKNKKVACLKGIIDLYERRIKHLQETQESLEVLVEQDVLTDGDYLRLCNENLEEIKNYKKNLRKTEKQLYKLTK